LDVRCRPRCRQRGALYSSANTSTRFDDGKFVTPMIANGKVYIGTPSGVVMFGLLR
jgi:hypothetical protein